MVLNHLYLKSTFCIIFVLKSSNFLTQCSTDKRTTDVLGKAHEIAEIELNKYENWDQLLTSTPLTIALLGHLVLLTSENDFTLEENAPKEGFMYLKYPSSFRASLVQLTNTGGEAFNEAHANMDSIRLHTQNINTHVQMILRVLSEGNKKEADVIVKMTLKKITRIADECLRLSESVEDKFVYFTKTATELLEASTLAKGVYEDKLKETQVAIEAAKYEEESAKREKEILEQQYEELKIEIQNAQEHFKETLKDMPSSAKLFGLSLLDGTWGVLKTFIPGFRSPMFEEFQSARETESSEDRARKQGYRYAEEIKKHVEDIVEVVTSGNTKGSKTPNWNERNAVQAAKYSLNYMIKNIKKENFPTDVHRQAIHICKDTISICEQFEKMRKDMSPKQEGVEDLVIKAEDILIVANEFYSQSNEFLYSSGPRMSYKTSMFSSSLVHNELIKSHIKVDSAKDVLEETRRKQEEIIRNMKKSNAQIEDALKDMATFNTKNVDFDNIRKTLVKGLKAIQDVRKQWGQLVRFFKMISRTFKLNFYEEIETFKDLAGIELDTGDLTRKLVSESAFKVLKVAFGVNTIASTYTEISTKYLIDEINDLPGLAALDPYTDKEEIEEKRQQLNENCKKAQRDIQDIIMKKRQGFSEKVQKQIEQHGHINNK